MNGFSVCQIDTDTRPVPAYSRRDFYTICLLTGSRQQRAADQELALDDTCLCIGNPAGAGMAEGVTTRHTGYACRFTETFFKEHSPVVYPAQWSLLSSPAPRVFSLDDQQATYLSSLFEKMLAEQQTAYRFKQELLCNYLQLVVHEALRLHMPSPTFRYYFRPPGPAGELSAGRRSRQRRSG